MATPHDYTFKLNENVDRAPVRFMNRYGIKVAADLYVPKDASGKLAALRHRAGRSPRSRNNPQVSTPTSSRAVGTSPSCSTHPSPERAPATPAT